MRTNFLLQYATDAEKVLAYFNANPESFHQFALDAAGIIKFRLELDVTAEEIAQRAASKMVTIDDIEFLREMHEKGVTHFSADMMSDDEYKRAKRLQGVIGRFDVDDSATVSVQDRMFIGVRELVCTVIHAL